MILMLVRWYIMAHGRECAAENCILTGGVVSPLLANLFLHYAFDAWVRREISQIPFCRYAYDGLLHCKSLQQAGFVLKKLAARL